MYGILFVCMGNICRSPTAEGICRHRAEQQGLTNNLTIDSAGVISYHAGEHPDKRASALARQNGIDISSLTARCVTVDDFKNFDLILTAERSQAKKLQALRPNGIEYQRAKIETMMSFAPEYGLIDVPDPYYGGNDGFLDVFHMLNDVCRNVLLCLKQEGKIR